MIEANDGEIPLSHEDFYQVVKKMGDPKPQAPDIKPEDFKSASCPIEPNHNELYGIPTLAEFGFEEPKSLSAWIGGEYHALERLKIKMKNDRLMTLPKRYSFSNLWQK